jgi:hypothetical protein
MRGRLSVAMIVVVLAGLPGSGVAAGDLSTLVGPYLAAQKEKAVGAIAGHAYAESPRRQAPPTPYPSVQVRLLPYSAQFEAQLDAIKSGLRDSLKNYGEAVTRFEDARVAYERTLLEAGGGGLIQEGVTDAAGTIRLAQVPTGEWLLVAWWETGHQRKTSKPATKVGAKYADIPITVDYSTVAYWRQRISVKPGEVAEVTLSDRAVWMTAVREEVLDASSGRPGTSGRAPTSPFGAGTLGAPGGLGTPIGPGGGLTPSR